MSWTCPRCHTDYAVPRERCLSDGHKLVANMAGHVIGERYQLEKLIGVGGMRSTVWRALQRPTDRPVAVKLLPAATPDEARRFERGARIASNLNHPHITTVHDYGIAADGTFYLVMELLEGRTLQQMVNSAPIGVFDTLVMVDQVLRALEHAHAQKIVHRDLKPSNLFVTRKNDDIFFVKIMDFGIAKRANGDGSTERPDDDPDTPSPGDGPVIGDVLDDITEGRAICGTPEYMSPEQIVAGPLDQRTDIYALGGILYRMLSGRLPFNSRARHDIYRQHLSSVPPPFPEALEIPEALSRIVFKALSKKPADRYADAGEMRRALRAANTAIVDKLGKAGKLPSYAGSVAGDATPTPQSLSSPLFARRRLGPLLAAAAIVLAAVVTPIVVSSGSSADEPRAGGMGTTTIADPPSTPTGEVGAGAAKPEAHVATARPPEVPVAAARPADILVAATRPSDVPVAAPVPPDVAAAPEAQHGTVSLHTTPPGAEVWSGGKRFGATPLQLVLEAGEHTLELRAAGFSPSVVSVTVTAGKAVPLSVPLVAVSDGARPRKSPTRPTPAHAEEPASHLANPLPKAAFEATTRTTPEPAEPTPDDKPAAAAPDAPPARPQVRILGAEPAPAPKTGAGGG